MVYVAYLNRVSNISSFIVRRELPDISTINKSSLIVVHKESIVFHAVTLKLSVTLPVHTSSSEPTLQNPVMAVDSRFPESRQTQTRVLRAYVCSIVYP